MLPGITGGTWIDLGGGLAEGMRAGAESVRQYSKVHTIHIGATPATATGAGANGQLVKLREHQLGALNGADVPTMTGVAKGSADVVTISHALASESDWSERLHLACEMQKPGGLLAVCDLAQPAPASPTSMPWHKVRCALRAAFWGAARGEAPHHAAVVSTLRTTTEQVHFDQVPACWPIFGQSVQAAHFLYVGRIPSSGVARRPVQRA